MKWKIEFKKVPLSSVTVLRCPICLLLLGSLLLCFATIFSVGQKCFASKEEGVQYFHDNLSNNIYIYQLFCQRTRQLFFLKDSTVFFPHVSNVPAEIAKDVQLEKQPSRKILWKTNVLRDFLKINTWTAWVMLSIQLVIFTLTEETVT